MKRIGEDYELSNGNIIKPHKGIIGLKEVNGFEIFEGYDGSWGKEPDEWQYLNDEELKEIALYMSNLWLEYSKTL